VRAAWERARLLQEVFDRSLARSQATRTQGRFSFFLGVAHRDMNDSSEKAHGVQALACRFSPLENGSRRLKLELHALFSI